MLVISQIKDPAVTVWTRRSAFKLALPVTTLVAKTLSLVTVTDSEDPAARSPSNVNVCEIDATVEVKLPELVA